jgi:hypothetical protein
VRLLINVTSKNLPKPKGTTGATKMKILSVICYNAKQGVDSYGYNIWQDLKEHFFTYMNDNDIRNVYHHLNDLCRLKLLEREKTDDEGGKCYYYMTNSALDLRYRYQKYLDILESNSYP